MPDTAADGAPAYVLDHADPELQRLAAQAAFSARVLRPTYSPRSASASHVE